MNFRINVDLRIIIVYTVNTIKYRNQSRRSIKMGKGKKRKLKL